MRGRKREYDPNAKCKVEGCEKKRVARDWCKAHYMDFYRKLWKVWDKENTERRRKKTKVILEKQAKNRRSIIAKIAIRKRKYNRMRLTKINKQISKEKL
jgi:hypothetical protein